MIIKRFQGKNEAEATEAAKKELGEAVVVMNVRTIKKKGLMGLFASPQTEITVGLEEEGERAAAPKAPTMTALEQLAARQKEINAAKQAAEQAAARPAAAPAPKEDQVATESVAGGSRGAAPGSRISLVTPDVDINPTQGLAGITAYSDRRDGIEEKLESLESLLKSKLDGEEKSGEEEEEQDSEQKKISRLLYDMMIENEVCSTYATAIIEEAEKGSKSNMPIDYFLTNIYQKMILKFGNPSFITDRKEGTGDAAKLIFFVGPTGVGKTTTIAKLASKLCLEEKKKVALLTADTYRIAAAEQLRTYANILEIPFRIVYSPAEVEQYYEEFKGYQYILVDTAGHSQHNEEQKKNTESMIEASRAIGESQVYLVLSATTKYRDLIDIADTYKTISDVKIIFTKLDETSCLGNLMNLRLYTGYDLSYVTYGQNVPDDISKFNPQATVKSILGGQGSGKQ